jgi:hypothetical protein
MLLLKRNESFILGCSMFISMGNMTVCMANTLCSALESCVYERLAKEMGICAFDEAPSVSVTKARSGSNGSEQLEFLVDASGAEHLRISSCGEAPKPYMIITGITPSPSEYRLTVYVPRDAFSKFEAKHSNLQENSNPLHNRIAGEISRALYLRTVLRDSDVHFDFPVAREELGLVDAELARNYLIDS